jgi:hypothetical protein
MVCLPFLGIVNFAFITIAMYASVRPYIYPIFPWLNIGIFFGVVVFLTLIAILLIYKFIVPSLWHFRGKQMFYESDILSRIKKIEKKLGVEDDEKSDSDTSSLK